MDPVKLFLKLISIPSPSGSEKSIGKFIYAFLKPYVDYLHQDKSGNIYGRKTGKGEPILLCAHMDTVNPSGKENPIIKNGMIQAGGAYVLGADDKSAVAAILSAVQKISTEKKPHTSFEILITVREETDCGMRDFPRKKIKSKTALLADLANPIGDVVTASPYVLGYSVQASAPGSHVRLVEKNTIHPLRYLTEFTKRLPYGRNSKDTITNIAIVKMGESYNSVPQTLYFSGEIRTFKKNVYEKFVSDLKKTTHLVDRMVGTTSTLSLFPYCQGYELQDKDVKDVESIMKDVGVTFHAVRVFSVGDFNVLKEWGIVPINIATGGIDAHTTRERILIKSLHQLSSIFFHTVLGTE